MHLTPIGTARPTILRSPETAQTYADNNSILWHQLRWLPASRELVATITFSNFNYVSRVEPRHDETFNFPIPGVKLSARDTTFCITGAQGEIIPVATLQHGLLGPNVQLLPTARMLVTNRSGCVAVQLIANETPLAGNRWVER